MELNDKVLRFYRELLAQGYTPKEIANAFIELVQEIDLNESIAKELNTNE